MITSVTLHVSHKQEPDQVLSLVKGLLGKNIPVNLQPTNAKASRQVLREIQNHKSLGQVKIKEQIIHIQP